MTTVAMEVYRDEVCYEQRLFSIDDINAYCAILDHLFGGLYSKKNEPDDAGYSTSRV